MNLCRASRSAAGSPPRAPAPGRHLAHPLGPGPRRAVGPLLRHPRRREGGGHRLPGPPAHDRRRSRARRGRRPRATRIDTRPSSVTRPPGGGHRLRPSRARGFVRPVRPLVPLDQRRPGRSRLGHRGPQQRGRLGPGPRGRRGRDAAARHARPGLRPGPDPAPGHHRAERRHRGPAVPDRRRERRRGSASPPSTRRGRSASSAPPALPVPPRPRRPSAHPRSPTAGRGFVGHRRRGHRRTLRPDVVDPAAPPRLSRPNCTSVRGSDRRSTCPARRTTGRATAPTGHRGTSASPGGSGPTDRATADAGSTGRPPPTAAS